MPALIELPKLLFDISMLMYGEMLKLAELSHSLADFGHLQKMFLALKCWLLDQTGQKFQFDKYKNFWTSGEKYDSKQHHFRVQETTKT